MFEIIKKWQNNREAKKAEKAKTYSLFDNFVSETAPLVPRASKHPKAALYRHCWKRAVVLHQIFSSIEGMEEQAELYEQFQELAARKYSPIAPQGAYGPIRLELSGNAYEKLRAQEIKRLTPAQQNSAHRDQALACIYLGIDTKHRNPYIGQTLYSPEIRWKQHRIERTGPFKSGAEYATWKVLKENVPQSMLDEFEAYYIGFYNSYEKGHNETKGNNWQAYERGLNDRH